MIDTFTKACHRAVRYLGQVKMDIQTIGAYQNELQIEINGSCVWMEFTRKAIYSIWDENPEVLNLFIRDTGDFESHKRLVSLIRPLFRQYKITGDIRSGRNSGTGICTTVIDVEGDPDRISVFLGILRVHSERNST